MPDPAIYLLVLSGLIALLITLFLPQRGLAPRWRQHLRLTQRVRIEDALKHIHHCEAENRQPSLQSLAGALQVTTDQAAEILGRLETHELVRAKDGELRLTANGREYALRVIRAHRLWERYLADETGFEEPSWHTQADEQEHFLSPEEIDALSAQLGHPLHDPHGDPIPSASGEMAPAPGRPLPELAPEARAVITHLEDEPETIYAQLVAEGLHTGMEIRLAEVSPSRIRFWSNGDEHRLAPMLARNVTVIPIPEPETEAPAGMPLSALQPGQSAQVLSISQKVRGAERRRLLDLGILAGTAIAAEIRSPSGDPTAYRVRGALIALREEQAQMIRITIP